MALIIHETQHIIATNDFDGTAPTAANQDLKSGDLVYIPATAGGLFVCPMNRIDATKAVEAPSGKLHVRRVRMVKVIFGLQTSWSISIVNYDDEETIWVAGLLETDLVITDEVDLTPGDKISLVTTGASTAMVATVTYEMARDLQ